MLPGPSASSVDAYDDLEPPRVWGAVPVEGRGHLPFALLHGESLIACAAWAVGEAGADLVDLDTGWEMVRDLGGTLLVHDPLCPATPPDFLARALGAAADGHVVVAHRPVTDTLKVLDGDRVTDTLDRGTVHQVTSPVVVPVALLDAAPDLVDLAGWVRSLMATHEVVWLEAPEAGARVADEAGLRVLAASTTPR